MVPAYLHTQALNEKSFYLACNTNIFRYDIDSSISEFDEDKVKTPKQNSTLISFPIFTSYFGDHARFLVDEF